MSGRVHAGALALLVALACTGQAQPAGSARAGPPSRRAQEAALAEAAARRGDREEAARRALGLTAEYQRDGTSWSAEDRTAAGRAYVILGEGNPDAVRAALRAFDAAVAADSGAVEPRLRLGDLFLDKYNAPDARESYRAALRLAPGNPRALLGIARVLAFEGNPEAFDTARKSLAADPSLGPAHALLARLQLDAEQYDSAAAEARLAVALDSSLAAGWAALGATAWLRGDSAGYARARAGAGRTAEFWSDLADQVARHRRYAEAAGFGREAVARDSLSPRALGVLGMNELRLGEMERGRGHLERAFDRDPFHVWYKNTLDLLDGLRSFRTIERGRFRIVAPAAEAELLALYLAPLLEEAYDTLSARYEYRPPPPIRIELYRHSADFSVRTVGLTGIGALGVSFGTVLAMDAPSARDPGEFNWGSTAWHELTHTFTLGLSAHRVPRWFSEGLSVLEEHRARPGWGAGPSPEFLATFKAGRLLPVSRLNEGFVRPTHPAELGFSYYQASLVCEMIEREKGRAALVAMLRAWRDGLDTPGVLFRVLGMTPAALDRHFAEWLRTRFAGPLASLAAWDGKGEVTGEFPGLLQRAEEALAHGDSAAARQALLRAETLFPEYAGPGAPALALAHLFNARGDRSGAVAALARYNALNESAWEANDLEARLREALDDHAGAAAALRRILWISPYDAGVHTRLAELAERMNDQAVMVRERRAVVALGPADPLEARYQLARALARSGDAAAARREVLQVLEQAPGFEKAQALLLELRGKTPEGRTR
ncbi:MAG TPA: hypothetical protein VGQ17_16235 [Gemmatimonadales bacterium]|nr:hypothetical protein [Gemmatimonadales bacterium]